MYDVGQAYEMVKESHLRSSLNYVLRVAENTGVGMQQVFNSMRTIVSACRSFHRDKDDRVAIVTKTIRKVVEAYLQFKIYRVGVFFVQQVSGVPVGGFLSSALLFLYLSSCEDYFDKHLWPGIARHFNLPNVRQK